MSFQAKLFTKAIFFLTNNLKHSHQSFLEKSLQLREPIQQEVVAFPHREQSAIEGMRGRGKGECFTI